MLYMFRTPFASIIRSTINCNSSHWCFVKSWDRINPVQMFKVGCALRTSQCAVQSILVVVNKHNTARVASCWFIIYHNDMSIPGLTDIRIPWRRICHYRILFVASIPYFHEEVSQNFFKSFLVRTRNFGMLPANKTRICSSEPLIN